LGCRRAPEFKFPVAYEDSYRALEWLKSEESTAHLPPNVDYSRVFLSGDSAGGNIAHHVAVRAGGGDLGRVQLKGVVMIQGFFGGEERTPAELRLRNVPIVSVESLDWHWKAFLPAGASRDHPACNVFGPHSPDLAQVPFAPVLNIIGKLDILQDWEVH
jgi:gibberellin receptor GID1